MSRSPADLLKADQKLTLANVADGAEGLVLSDLARAIAAKPGAPAISLVVICRDGPRMSALSRGLSFFAPDLTVMEFPAWDCLPYDRVSPHAAVLAQRMTALSPCSACRRAPCSPVSRCPPRPATCSAWRM
jgi:transcription-repair coupling factor (superfamily II helicase)